MPAPSVFISYSHKDEVWKDHLVKHLSVLQREGLLRTWDDRRIQAGQDWFREIETAMAEARVAVLLISAESLDSDFIRTNEVPLLLKRRAEEGVTIFPVIVKDCPWEAVEPLASLQVRPRDGKPLDSFRPARTSVRPSAPSSSTSNVSSSHAKLATDAGRQPPPGI